MLAVTDPTFFVTLYCHKHLPGFVEVDPRRTLIAQVEHFVTLYALEPEGTQWAYTRVADIDLVALDRSEHSYLPLLNFKRGDAAASGERRLFQVLVYAYLDMLVAQFVLAKFGAWRGTLQQGWDELEALLDSRMDGRALDAAAHGTFGASCVYWAITAEDTAPNEYRDAARALLANDAAHASECDIGWLWQDAAPFLDAPRVHQTRWLLLTPRAQEREADCRYNQPSVDQPPLFVRAAAAHHKFAFERAVYARERAHLKRLETRLDQRARWLVETQRAHGAALGDLRAPPSNEFQEKLARAVNTHADFVQSASQVRELLRTLQVNRRNFAVFAAALAAAQGAAQVANAPDQAAAARAFLQEWQSAHTDEIFNPALGQMESETAQIDSDMEYTDRLTERYNAALRAARLQLQMASERQIAEISGGGNVNTALVVASLAVVIAVEILQLSGALAQQPWFAANLILLTLAGTFYLSLVITAAPLHTRARRLAFAFTCGFLCGAVFMFDAQRAAWQMLALNALAFFVGLAGGSALHWAFELRFLAAQRRACKQRENIQRALDALRDDADELPELLEDLPPTSLVELAPEILADADGLPLKHTGDLKVLGAGYSVPPWQVAPLVDRILAVTHPLHPAQPILYKNTTAVIGYLAEKPSGRTRYTDDPNYHGTQRGLRVNDKAIQLDVDLLGIGARDQKRLAQIQIRTPLQAASARWFQDKLRVDASAKARHARWQDRLRANVWIWLTDAELWMFGSLMEWGAKNTGVV